MQNPTFSVTRTMFPSSNQKSLSRAMSDTPWEVDDEEVLRGRLGGLVSSMMGDWKRLCNVRL